MRTMIWLFLLLPFAISCAKSDNIVPSADHTSSVSVRIATAETTARPVVAICNNTTNELRVWRDGNSWGWWNVSFCVAMDDGRVIHVQRSRVTGFTSNGPVAEAIAPGKEVTRTDLDFHDRDWELPKDFDLDKVRYICAIYFIEPTKESAEQDVWTGIVVSPWVALKTAGEGGNSGATAPRARKPIPARKPQH
jgi:hypothetical protein